MVSITLAIATCLSLLFEFSNAQDGQSLSPSPTVANDINSFEDASCSFYGHWVLDSDTWPEFPLLQKMRPITLRPEGDKYRLLSRIDNLFSTLMLPEGPYCDNRVVGSRTTTTLMATPNWEAEEAWLNMLDNIRRIKNHDGKLIVWFSEGFEWKRIEFLRVNLLRD